MTEKIKYPNPECGRRILDHEEVDSKWTVLEIKCQHCGKKVRLYYDPDGVEARLHRNRKRQGSSCCFFAKMIKAVLSGLY